MEMAIAFGLEGAGYIESPTFNSVEQAAIIALIEANVPSGGGENYLGQFFVNEYLDSSTLYPPAYDTLAVTADVTYALPVLVHRPCQFGSARVNVTSGSAGNVTAALYSAWPNPGEYPETPGYPGELVAEALVAQSTASTGNKTMSFGAPVVAPGLYYIAVQFSATPTVTSIAAAAPGIYTTGTNPLTGAYDNTTTYGTFDDPFDNDAWGLESGEMPRIQYSLGQATD